MIGIKLVLLMKLQSILHFCLSWLGLIGFYCLELFNCLISSRFTKPKLIEQSELIKYQSKSIKYQSNPIEFIFFLTLIALQLVELIEDDHLFNSISIWLIWLLFRPFWCGFWLFQEYFDLKSLYIENHLLSEPNFKNYVPNFNFAILFILAKFTHNCPYQEDWRNLHSITEKSKNY